MIKQIITQGIVLKRTNFQEADRILTLLTSDQGKVRLLAKGVRKSKSKLAGGVELLSISEIGFITGKGDIGTLTTARLERHFGNIVTDINRTTMAYDILKLLDKTTEDNVDSDYFHLLEQSLAALNDGLEPELLKLWCDVQLLKISGHSPNLKTDTANQPLAGNQNYNFDIEAMSFHTHPHGPYGAGHIKLLRLCHSQSAENLGQVLGIDNYLASTRQLVNTVRRHILHV